MINEKQNQWRKASKQLVYRDSGVMEALKRLYGSTNKAGCCVCGEDEPELLGIHESDDSNDFKVLCRRCCCNLSGKYNKTEARVYK